MCPTDEYGEFLACGDLCNHACRIRDEVTGRIGFIWISNVYEMMRYPSHVFFRYFLRTDIESTVHLA